MPTNLKAKGEAKLHGVTAGTATASKVLVVDSNKNLSGLGKVTVADIGTNSGTATATGSGTASSCTINSMAGIITTPTMTASAGSTHVITLTNSHIAASDTVYASMTSTSAGSPFIQYVTPSTGSATITILNIPFGSTLNAPATVSFIVFKAS